MADEYNTKVIGTVILSIAMMGFGLAFYEKESLMYLVLVFIGVVLALMVASGTVSSKK